MNSKLQTLFLSGLLVAVSPLVVSAQGYSSEIPSDISQKMKPATIKVQLIENADSLILEAKGKYQLCNPVNHFVISSGSFSKRAKVHHNNNGIHWGELIPGTFQLRIVPKNSETTILVNGIQYRGCVDLYDMNGKFMVVNEVDVESFLRSTMSQEFKNEMDQEVLSAVVITERTNLYYMLRKKGLETTYHVKAAECGYRGHGATLINTTLESAISSTRHAIMTYEGAPFPATFSENSAGRTATYSSIYRKNVASPSGVEIPFAESDRQKMGWSFSIDKDELAKISQVSQISQISLFSDKSSGKVYALKIGDGHDSRQMDFLMLQKSLGESKLKSNDFTIDVKGEEITFKGYGKGLGTGLCLYSAELMAKQGQDALKILNTFFPGVKVEKLRTISSKAKNG